MGFFSTKKEKAHLPWIQLNQEQQIIDAIESSSIKPVLFFKHSTRCSISSMALSRFEEKWDLNSDKFELYFLDLIAFRSISNLIAEKTRVEHQSPQVIVMHNKQVIYNASHSSINAEAIDKLI